MKASTAYILSRIFTKQSLDGLGAIKGASCTIKSIVDNGDGTHTITFEWVSNSGASQTGTLVVKDGEDGADGLGIKSVEVDANNHVIVTYDDDTTADAGLVPTVKGDKGDTGEDGFSPTIEVTDITGGHKVSITDADGTQTFDVMDGQDGEGAVSSVNGKTGTVTLDANDVGALPDDTELFSGDYEDLTNKPTLFSGDYDDLTNKPTLFSGDYDDLTNKPDLSQFITKAVNDLTNYYLKTDTYTKTEVDNIITAVKNSRFEAVDALPTTDIQTNVIYLVPKSTGQTNNAKDEYINLDGTTEGWEKIGDTEIDLSGYVTTTALNTALADYTTTANLTTLLNGKVDKVTGKGLSTNDYTNADKAIVDGVTDALADKADADDIPDVSGFATNDLLKDTVGWTGKNLLKNTASTTTTNGITFTVNGDGSVTVNGTATATTIFAINSAVKSHLVENGKYILSGCPTGGASDTYRMDLRSVASGGATEPLLEDTGDGRTFTLSSTIYSNYEIGIYIRIADGTTVSNLTFYPMLRRADIADDTYEPYHESVETMYEEEIHGVNLLNNANSTQTINGVTFTINSDSSVKINGTATANTSFIIFEATENLIPSGDYIVSVGNLSGRLDVNKHNGSTYVGTITSVGTTVSNQLISLDYADYDNAKFVVFVPNWNTVSNATIYPMLRKATIEDSTYRPYNEQAIQNQLNNQTGVLGAKNLLPINLISQVYRGVTFTVNDDYSITASGTVESGYTNANIRISQIDITDLVGKTVIVTGGQYLIDGAFYLFFDFMSSSDTMIRRLSVDATTPSIEYTIPSDAVTLNTTIILTSDFSGNAKTVYPMLRLASDPDNTYQPYTKTNQQLTEDVDELNTLSELTDVSQITVTDSSILEVERVRLNKKGSVLNGFFLLNVKSTLPYNSTLLTLPSGFRPSRFSQAIGFENETNSTSHGLFGVWPNGSMQLQLGFKGFTGSLRIAINAII